MIGGSFNPPHIGHAHLISLIEQSGRYDRILLIPLHTPSHKKIEYHTAPEHRVSMTGLLAGDCRIACTVDTCEIDRGGISYTYDTVCDIMERYRDITGRPAVVIGDDLLGGLNKWYRIEELKQLVTFETACRDEHAGHLDRMLAEYSREGYTIQRLPGEPVEVSSSTIRQALAEDLPIRGLLPGRIEEYIRIHGLYQQH